MAAPRAVRIPRRPAGTTAPPRVAERETPRQVWDAAAGTGAYASNVEGTSRAFRVFTLFGLGVLLMLAVFAGLAATSPSPGVSQSWTVYALLVVVSVVLALIGAAITVLRAPRGARFEPDAILVTERLGRRRRWPTPPTLSTRVVQRYPAGAFGLPAAELVELSDGAGHRAAYIVGRGFFDREPAA